MTTEQRLTKLELEIAKSNAPAMPLPDTTQRLYRKAFGDDFAAVIGGKTVAELLTNPEFREALLQAEEMLEREYYGPLRLAGEPAALPNAAELSGGD